MKGGSIYSDGRNFYAKDNADDYSKIEADMLNFLQEKSPTANAYLITIVKKPGAIFDSNFLYRNHSTLQQIYMELNDDQRASFIDRLKRIIEGRLQFPNFDRGHADQIIIMHNVLRLFGESISDTSRFALLTRAEEHHLPPGATEEDIERSIQDLNSNLTRRRRETRRNVARDAAMEGLIRARKNVARDAAMEGLRQDVLRGIKRTRLARLARLSREVVSKVNGMAQTKKRKRAKCYLKSRKRHRSDSTD